MSISILWKNVWPKRNALRAKSLSSMSVNIFIANWIALKNHRNIQYECSAQIDNSELTFSWAEHGHTHTLTRVCDIIHSLFLIEGQADFIPSVAVAQQMNKYKQKYCALLIVIKLWRKSPQPAVLGDTAKSFPTLQMDVQNHLPKSFLYCLLHFLLQSWKICLEFLPHICILRCWFW